jgi:IS30 family transposase
MPEQALTICPRGELQCGTNEHTNGLLRQYLPQSVDPATGARSQLDQIAAELSESPGETPGWMALFETANETLEITSCERGDRDAG